MRHNLSIVGDRLRDSFGRVHDDLRISVTDRCNLRCTYCMPEDPVWFDRAKILTYEEMLRLVRVAIGRGVSKVRLTGGEPLVRRDLDRFVAMLSAEPGVDDLSLTTNGLLLGAQAARLAAAGLSRINVSLDTLSPGRFAELTRRDVLPRVLAGLEAAADAGLSPIKVNVVLLRGRNDDEVEELVRHARGHGWELRFIEVMPLENDRTWSVEQVVSGEEIRDRIDRQWPLEPYPCPDPSSPSRRYRFKDGRGTLGFINSVTEPFCSTCSRLRLTADGHFRVCLYDDAETDLRTPLRAGASDEELGQMMFRALEAKGRGGALDILESQQAPPLKRTMHQIGG